MSSPRGRLTADERRTEVIAAATREFAARGYAGGSTQAIARRVGVSQPYLFQLFGTKKGLFLAAVHDCFERVRTRFDDSGRAARARDDDPLVILTAMGLTYHDLMRDRDMLRLQLQAYAACDDSEIRDAVRAEWTALYQTVATRSGADERALHAWFAEGMLLNVAASIADLETAAHLKLTLGGALART
jgi:AcrR family transcriptional regulator